MNFQRCPHCRITVLPNADQICPSCRQAIPILDAIPVDEPIHASLADSALPISTVTATPECVTPLDTVDAQTLDSEAIVDVPRENISKERYRPEPGVFQSLGLIVGLFMVTGFFGGLLGGLYGLITQSTNGDDYVPIGMAAGSLAAFFLAWSGTQPQPAKALAMVRTSWQHLLIACLLPLSAQLLFVASQEAYYRVVPPVDAYSQDTAQTKTSVATPIAATGHTIAAQSWRERIFSHYDILARKSWFVVLLVGCFLPAVCEELFFRGYLGRGLLAQLGCIGGILVTSLLFGLVHLEPGQMIFTGLLGVALHVLYLCSKSIWAPMLMHFVNNVLAFGSMKMMHAGQLPVQANGTFHVPWFVTLASALVLIALLRLMFATRVGWTDAEGTAIDVGYPTAEVPDTFPCQRRQVTPSFFSYAFVVATVLLLAGTSLTSLFQNQGSLAAWRDVNEGDEAITQGNYAEAMKHFQNAVAHDPTLPEGYCGRALAAIGLDQPEQAKLDATHALELRSNYPVALTALAEAKLMLADVDSAFDDARRACQQDPKNQYPHMVRAQCEAAQGHYAAALSTSQLAKDLAPNDVFPRLWRCELFTHCADVKLRNPLAAIAELKSPGFEMPDNAECHAALAAAYMAHNKLTDAVAEFKAVQRLSGENSNRQVEYSLFHLEQVGKTLVELRTAWDTQWIDDVIMLVPSRRLIVIVPASQVEELNDKTLDDMPELAGWTCDVRTQEAELRESHAAIGRLQQQLGVDYYYAESIVSYAARTREELAACDVTTLATTLNIEPEQAQAIILAARQTKP
jgi:membrane protease YdiL (CAAX protease family)/tetratricopeptide (TPR) repeat protein